MLRSAVVVLALMLIAGGGAAVLLGFPSGVSPLIGGGFLLFGTLCERAVYKRIEPRPGASRFHPTAERFFDDATGAPVTVWTDPKTGERKYVRD